MLVYQTKALEFFFVSDFVQLKNACGISIEFYANREPLRHNINKILLLLLLLPLIIIIIVVFCFN